ncbi:MAG: DUF1893 domain-containing protein [Candidatus Brockarchaeota archaeon]|nr:DUF1893 domain-containing protein [Candidatus Brockarchaeota archaeon]MBO3809815.1 DUF1893 domain-containing protein [Candidatus Brockarchaeota archaeon]
MKGLETAKRILKDHGFSLVIVKPGTLFHATRKYGVIGLVEAIENYGPELSGAAVADRVVGRAAAMLCLYANIAEVYAEVVSRKGLDALREKNVSVEYEELVPEILNRNRNDVCPFEKLAADCHGEEELFKKIVSLKDRFL